ncbi:hypothetical protein [Caulobacter sp. RL271]|uniref:Uncharacterized protein n=1 Tax=Caulobacter segnis TaxID=88688 RepID=A0ABY4ZV99_9CAUL|nr:hypothetical protein [Caulobacter segnis]USQ95937.1 hypothetical protein MZV50_25940 [Caulobacter segnis]
MRFMVLLKVEAEVGPELTRAMRAYDAELVRAGWPTGPGSPPAARA